MLHISNANISPHWLNARCIERATHVTYWTAVLSLDWNPNKPIEGLPGSQTLIQTKVLVMAGLVSNLFKLKLALLLSAQQKTVLLDVLIFHFQWQTGICNILADRGEPWEKYRNWVDWSDLLNTPYGLIPYISYTCYCSRFKKFRLHPILHHDPPHRHAGPGLIPLKDPSLIVRVLTESHCQQSACFTNTASPTFIGNAINAMCHLL
jgi:hypothetical protein